MKKRLFLILISICISHLGFSQQTIQGTVTDETGLPLPGVTIMIEGTVQGVITNLDGLYNIEAGAGQVLVFSMIGMETRRIPIEGRTTINVVLQTSTAMLEEVVVVGYGSARSKDLTAPIRTVSSEEISRQTTANPAQALQGKVAGVHVTNTGEPGSQPQIRIRGVSTALAAGTGPLYVVDGVIVDNISFLNNNDIESITVLKDASAGAIYGVQAANGVLLITTKKGVKGAPKVTFSSYSGFQNPTNVLEMANKDQYIEMLNLRTGLTGIGDFFDPEQFNVSTHWYNELLRKPLITSHEIGISGGGENSTYTYGIGYFYQDGLINTGNPDNSNNFNRLNFRARNDYTFSNVSLGYNLIFSKNNTTPGYNYSFFQAFVAPPAFDAGNAEDGWSDPTVFGFSGPFANPAASAYYHDVYNEEYNIIPSTYFSLEFLEHFTFRTSLAATIAYSQGRGYNPVYFVSGLQNNATSSLNKNSNLRRNLLWDNTLDYSQNIMKHRISVMVGSSMQELFGNNLSGQAYNVPRLGDATYYLRLGDDNTRTAADGGYRHRVASFFSRLSYAWDSKYLLTATIRGDGSSKYNENWGIFPSLGVGWILTQEDFMRGQNLVDFLKIRGSWGTLGNNNVPANSALIVGSPGPGTTGIFGGNNAIPGLTFQTVYNNFLQWETVEEFNAGLELYTLGSRLAMELDFYNRVTNNAVFSAPIPGVSGQAELLGNYGRIRNRGIDLSLTWTERFDNRDLGYSLSGNLSTVDNEVLRINNQDGILYGPTLNGAFVTQTLVGQPIGAFYGYHAIGVFQSVSDVNNYTGPDGTILQPDGLPGDLKFENVNGDDRIDSRDRVMIGSPIPKLVFGLTATADYKNWDVSVIIQGTSGNKIFNAKRANRNIFPDANYDLDFYENHWTGNGTSDEYPSPALSRRNIQPNSFFVESGSYVRIRNIQMGYTLPEGITSRIGLSSLRFYLSAQNPFTLFGYNGFTPEIGGSPIASAIDYDTYPLSSTYTFGLNVSF